MVKQARARVTYEQILAGAATVFGAYGYERAKLNDIVDAAGLTRGAVYFHFQSKEALAVAVIDRQHEKSISAVAGIAETGAPALAQIVMLCHEMGRQIMTDPAVQAGIRLTLEQSAGKQPQAPYQDWIDTCARLAETSIAEGDLLATVPVQAFANYVISSFTGVQMVANVLTERSDLPERIDGMWGLLLPGLMRPDSTHSRAEIQGARWQAPTDDGSH